MDKVRILVTGDIVIGQNRTGAVAAAAAILDRCDTDVRFGNLEVPLTERGFQAPKITAWRSSPAVARDLKKLGFHVLATANNHALDYGREGLYDTLAGLRQEGIKAVGSGADLDAALAPAMFTLADTKVAFLALACTLPLGSDAAAGRPGVAPIHVATSYTFDPADTQEEPGCGPTYIHTVADHADVQRVCNCVGALKANGYTTLVALHWGNAYQKKLAQYQPPLAAALEAAGCDLIVGHHPHTIHAVDVIGRMPVFYSLGNFVMDVTTEGRADRSQLADMAISWEPHPDALVGIVTVEAGNIRQVEILPITLDGDGLPGWPDEPGRDKVLADTLALSGGAIAFGQRERDRLTLRLPLPAEHP